MRILQARDIDFSDGITAQSEDYEGFVVDAWVIKTTKFMRDDLPKDTSLIFVNNKIQRINLPPYKQFKIAGVVCEGSIEFSDGDLCECSLVENYTVNGYTIKPPAQVRFYNKKFWMFRKSSGGYKTISKGKLKDVLVDTVDGFTCR